MLLVDGAVEGTWAFERKKGDAILRIKSFAKLTPKDQAEAAAEGERLARFMAPEATTHGVRFT